MAILASLSSLHPPPKPAPDHIPGPFSPDILRAAITRSTMQQSMNVKGSNSIRPSAIGKAAGARRVVVKTQAQAVTAKTLNTKRSEEVSSQQATGSCRQPEHCSNQRGQGGAARPLPPDSLPSTPLLFVITGIPAGTGHPPSAATGFSEGESLGWIWNYGYA